VNADIIRLPRLTLRFADADLERAFCDEYARKGLRPFRLAILCAVGVVLLLWLLMDNIFPGVPNARLRVSIPMLVLLATVVTGYLGSYRSIIWRIQQPFVLSGAWSITAAEIWMYSLLPQSSLPVISVMLVIHTLNMYTMVRLLFPWACYAGWGTAAMFLGYLGYSGTEVGTELVGYASIFMVTNLFGMIIAHQMDQSTRREFLALRDVAIERERSELEHERAQQLLHNILPVELVEELSRTGVARSARHESATILFTDFSGFTQVASAMPADRMVAELNEIFGAFDDICDELGVEKIKTIGDAYMAAAGLPKSCGDHALRCVRAGLRMLDYVEHRNRLAPFKWSLRVGVHSGPVVTGVVGKRKYAFDVWGDTVNIASRMESAGEAGRVNVSAYTYDLIQAEFACDYRGKVDAKGKGQVDMYFVKGLLHE
jgi:class 3 adenylate cyclase